MSGDELLTIAQAAKILKVTRQSMLRWSNMEPKRIDTIKVGKHWKIKKSAVDKIMDSGLKIGG